MNETSLKQQVRILIESGRSMGLAMLANACQKSELEVIKALPEEMGKLLMAHALTGLGKC